MAGATQLDFPTLVDAVREIDERCAVEAGKAVNVSLTVRNWLFGGYIHEYELNGADRATYGEGLLKALADRLADANVSNCNRRELYRYLRFFRTYPEIAGTLSPQFARLLPRRERPRKVGTLSPLFRRAASDLVQRLSYSHFEQLVDLDDDAQRAFYELESMRGNWSVRELKRQIAALYYERSGLSKDPKKLAALVESGRNNAEPVMNIRDPYIFEFLGLEPKEVMGESDLEDALLDKLQVFLLELGHGFCFEARQKRILIGDTHGFVDLVFYHRVLKCHVLIELKLTEFTHEHLGQLNTYVSWFKRNMMTAGDSPPVGLLLCTRKDHALVEYALADLPNRIFVSKYQLELPSREQIQKFIEAQLKNR
jgi:predicted nuclease of restriction endonuclease-like (RecB) superfamily